MMSCGELAIRQVDAGTLERCISTLALDKSSTAVLKVARAAGEALVAMRDSELVGVIAWHRHFFGCPFIALVAVAESARRQGIARALLEAVEAEVGEGKLFTSTNESNAVAQELFEHSEFVRSGRVENLDPGDSEILYYKRISRRSPL